MVRPSAKRQHQHGFSLIELLIVFVIAAILFVVGFVNLGRPQANATISGSIDTLLTDLKAQQSQAMVGGTSGLATAQAYGLYVQSSSYTVFAGTSYSAGNATNFVLTMPTGVSLSTTLPSSTVVFSKGTGEVQGFVSGSNTISLTNATGVKTITINRLGTLTLN